MEHKLRQIRNFVATKKAEIANDERYRQDPANIQINAPLALMQATLSAQDALLSELDMILNSSVSDFDMDEQTNSNEDE